MKVSAALLLSGALASKVTISNKEFRFGGSRLFISGANQAWHWYGYDFGDGQYYKDPSRVYQRNIDQVASNGGNSIRFWLHPVGSGSSPKWDGGYVTGTDGANTLIDELRLLLDYAESKNVLVTVCLWNGADPQINQESINLMWDESKLSSYINNMLVPMATALKAHKALFAWEIINEAEGLVRAGESDRESCFDTQVLSGTGAGWANKYVPMKNLLGFINRQAAAIKNIRGNEIMVTASGWSEKATINAHGYKNYFSDSCLRKAGGQNSGTLDFYQIHTYSNCQCSSGSWTSSQPMRNSPSDYNLDKPIILGEFSAVCSGKNSIEEMYRYFYEKRYDGAWGWQMYDEGQGHCSDGKTKTMRGIAALKNRSDNGNISIRL